MRHYEENFNEEYERGYRAGRREVLLEQNKSYNKEELFNKLGDLFLKKSNTTFDYLQAKKGELIYYDYITFDSPDDKVFAEIKFYEDYMTFRYTIDSPDFESFGNFTGTSKIRSVKNYAEDFVKAIGELLTVVNELKPYELFIKNKR